MSSPMTPDEARAALDHNLDWKAELTAGNRALGTIASANPVYVVRYERRERPTRDGEGWWVNVDSTCSSFAAAEADARMVNADPDPLRRNARALTLYVIDPEGELNG